MRPTRRESADGEAPRPGRRPALYLLFTVVLGLAAGVGWRLATPLATYTLGTDLRAVTTERGLAQIFAGDAWFSGLGVIVGLALGTLGWLWFGRFGWRVVPLVVVAAGVAALLSWGLGHQLDPGSFDERVAAARPGDVVPIDLAIRAPSVLLIWAVAAVAPVLVGSSLGRDPDDVAGPADEAVGGGPESEERS